MATLFAAKGGSTVSDLYTLEPTTGDILSDIGPIGYAVTGLAFDPTSGILYGSTSNNDPSDPHSIISIDATTGEGTLVGESGSLSGPAADICFDSTGQLYGWLEAAPDQLALIDKTTGEETLTNPAPFNTFGDAMDFDLSGTLWAFIAGSTDSITGGTYGYVYTVNPSTGAVTKQSQLTGGPNIANDTLAAGKFDTDGLFWAIQNHFPTRYLVTVNVSTGVMTTIGTMPSGGWDALAWGTGVAAPNFTLAVSPTTLTIANGDSDTSSLTTTALHGDTETITLSATGQPPGMTVSFDDASILASGGTTIRVTVGSTVGPGSHTITITATGELNTHTKTLTVFVPGDNLDCAGAVALHLVDCPTGTLDIDLSLYPEVADMGESTALWNYDGAHTVTYGPFTVPTGFNAAGGTEMWFEETFFGYLGFFIGPLTDGQTVTVTGTLPDEFNAGDGIAVQIDSDIGFPARSGFTGNWNNRFVFGESGAGYGGDPVLDLIGCSFFRQAWFKITNPSSSPAYAHFNAKVISVQDGSSIGLGLAEFFGTCGNLSLVRGDFSIATSDPIWEESFDSTDSDSTCPHEFGNRYGAGQFIHNPIGVLLQPGQTVYVAMGAHGGGKALSSQSDKGVIEFSWTLLSVEKYYDITDTRKPVSLGGVGGSDVITTLDHSGFEPTVGGPGGSSFSPQAARSYRFFGGQHFVAEVVQTDHGLGPSGTTNTQYELGVWRYAEDGTQLGFYSIGKRNFLEGSILVTHESGGTFDTSTQLNKWARFETDGTNLWLVAPGRLNVDNPYDLSGPHEWNPGCATVYLWTGSGFNLIDRLDAITANSFFFGGAFSGGSGPYTIADTYASPDEPGILHVILTEQGALDSPDTTGPSNSGFPGDYGVSHPANDHQWATATQHATFSTSARTSLATLYYDQSLVSATPNFDEPHHAYGEVVQVRNEGGTPFYVRRRPTNSYTDGGGYQGIIDICEMDGTVLTTIDHTLMDTIAVAQGFTTPINFAITSSTGLWLSRNTVIDPFDGRRIYLLLISDHTGNDWYVFRLDVTDLANPRYWRDNPAEAGSFAFVSLGKSGHQHLTPNTWWLDPSTGGTNSLVRYDDCPGINGEWGKAQAVLSYSPTLIYSGIVATGDIMHWVDETTVYYVAQAGWLSNAGCVAKTNLLENYYICSLSGEIDCTTFPYNVIVNVNHAYGRPIK